MLETFRKAYRIFVLLVVGATVVHLLEDHVPVCRCVAEAVREMEAYRQLQAYFTGPELASEAEALRRRLRSWFDDPPALDEIVSAQQRGRIEEARRHLHERFRAAEEAAREAQ